MKRDLLAALSVHIAANRSCATVTDAATGRQSLVAGHDVSGDLGLADTQLSQIRKRIQSDQSGVMDDGLFVRVYSPPPRMVIVGAVHIAQFLAPMAKLSGFEVTVIDPRAAFVQSGSLSGVTAIVAWPDEAMAKLNPDSRTAVVTLTHDPKLDDPALAAALKSPAFYIGALGSRKTHAKRLQRLAGDGFSDDMLARIDGPVGLDINAVTPAEIAVSIMAKVVSVLRSEAQ